MLASTLVTAFLAVTLFVFAKDPRTLRHHCTGTEDPKVQFFEAEFCRFCFKLRPILIFKEYYPLEHIIYLSKLVRVRGKYTF